MEQQRLHIEGEARSRDRHLRALLVPTRRRPVAVPAANEPHRCPECASDLVHPLDWAQAGARHWQVELRCPECEWRDESVYHQDVLDRFDAELDAGTAALIEDLTELTRANMEEESERFVAALRANLVLPEDF